MRYALPVHQLPELTTARLWLRPRQESDVPAMLRMDGDPAVMRYVGDGRVPDPASHEQRIRTRLREGGGDGLGFWSVFSQDRRDDLLGTVGLARLSDAPDIELVYRLRSGAWGRGYATEASIPCLAYAFRTLQLPEVVAMVYPDNHPSRRVIAKLGFMPAGHRLLSGTELLFFRLRRESFAGA
jgi:ribosomal-protein-alanine N-acetyltransferase